MQSPLQITFRHMAPSPALEARIRARIAELERVFERIVACRVIVEAITTRRQQGTLFDVRIDLTLPGREIAIGRDPGVNRGHVDAQVAVRDAFDAVRRRIDDHARKMRGDVKVHAVPDHGRIVRLLYDRDCGFIATATGEEIYFHRNSVANNAFDDLAVGAEVRFVAQEGESPNGPQASSVVPLGKHSLPPTETTRA
jgi:cold shock CspA family protein/ribosome-associated translation inhibitor RaiA